MTLQFKIRGQTLYKLTPGDVVEGTQNYINCQFDFQTEDWEGCIKTALFQPPGGVEPYPVMLVDGTCTAPWEALEHPGLVSVSVFGVRDNYKITSSAVQFRNRPTLTGGAATEPPTPTVYEQVLNDLAGTRQHATEQAQESKAAAGEAKGYAESAASVVDGFAAAAETASKAITAEGALQVSNVQSAGQTARQSVSAEGESQVAAVGAAGTEALQAVQDAAAEIVADREQISTNKDNIASLQSEMRTKADAIVRTVSGESLLVQDSSDNAARGLRVFGKTTQDGTPTPDAPVPLVSVGDAGSVGIGVYGKNLFNSYELKTANNVSLDVSDDGYTITTVGGAGRKYTNSSYTPRDNRLFGKTVYWMADSIIASDESLAKYINAQIRIHYADGSFSYHEIHSNKLKMKVEIPIDAVRLDFRLHTNNSNSAYESDVTVVFKGLRLSLIENAPWEHYKESQPLTLPTPNGLPGIPVDDESLANYTDADGQMWCSDEVDFGRGVYVQRICHKVFDGTESYVLADADGSKGYHFALVDVSMKYNIKGSLMGALCNKLCEVSADVLYGNICEGFSIGYKSSRFRLRFTSLPDITTVDALKSKLAEWYTNGEPLELITLLNTPIETPLTAEELAQYQALRTNYPVTTVLNDSRAGMEMQYNADTQLYIDNKITEVLASIANTNAQLL